MDDRAEREVGNATEFLDACRRAVGRLAALNARMDDMADNGYLRAISYDSVGSATSQASPVERAAMASDELWQQTRAAAKRYSDLLYMAQDAFSRMEQAGADSPGDVELLDYYYLQAKSARRIARIMSYSEDYVRQKKALAIVHVAPYIPPSW